LKDQEKITGKTFVNLIEDQASREFVPVDLLGNRKIRLKFDKFN
jgi:hypothetical protein